jgi:hypothetical protein
MTISKRMNENLRIKNKNRVYSHARASVSATPKEDLYDASKPHSLDAPHVVDALETQHILREEGLGNAEPGQRAPEADPLPLSPNRPALTQYTANCVRLRVMFYRAKEALKQISKGATDRFVRSQFGVVYIWFREPYADNYELRYGNPPADSERPVWMAGMKLHVDIWNPDELVRFANDIKMILEPTGDHRIPFIKK